MNTLKDRLSSANNSNKQANRLKTVQQKNKLDCINDFIKILLFNVHDWAPYFPY